MLENGVSPGESLSILARQQEHPRLAEALDEVEDKVALHGWSLSQSLGTCPDVFPSSCTMLVRAGETGGDLAGRLRKAGQLLERTAHLRNQVSQALTGPAITLTVGALVLLGVVKFVMPRFLGLYSQMDMTLPPLTVFVIGLVRFCNHPLTWLVLGSTLVALYVHRRRLLDNAFTHLVNTPVLRYWAGTVLCAQFCEVLGSLHREGVPLHTAVGMMVKSTPFTAHRAALSKVDQHLRTDGNLSQALRLVPYFPPLVLSMCEVGEETGALDTLLASLSRLLEQQVDTVIGQVVDLVEPVVVCLLGVVISVLFVGMFLPVYGILAKLGT